MKRIKNKFLTDEEKKARRKRRRKKTWIGIGIALALLIIIRLIIPPIVVAVINQKMSHMPDYLCRMEDIDLSLITGTVYVKNIRMTKKNSNMPLPFFACEKLKLSLEFDKFFKTGRLVGNITLPGFNVNLIKGPTPEQSQISADPKWLVLVDELMPIGINTLTVENGTLNYFDHKIEKKPAVKVDSIHVEGTNLTNAEKRDTTLPSKVVFSANCMGGKLEMTARLNLQYEGPDADINAKLTDLPIPSLNPLLRSYAKFDVQKGRFDLYAEFAMKDGKVKGYAKPLIRGLDIQDLSVEKKEKGSRKVWEAVLEVGAWTFKNKPKDQLATRIEIDGSLKKPYVSVWQVIGSALSNAFIQALLPGLEQSIDIRSPKGKNDAPKKDKPKKKKRKKK